MIRLSNTFVRTIVDAARFIEREHPEAWKMLGENNHEDNEERLPEIVGSLEAQLRGVDERAPGDLIEALALLFQEAAGRSVIPPRMIDAIRRALLRPDEMAAVVTMIRSRSGGMVCQSCGHPFDATNFEMAVTQSGAHPGLSCVRCLHALAVPCSIRDCNEVIPMSSKLRGMLEGFIEHALCGKHKEAKEVNSDPMSVPEGATGGANQTRANAERLNNIIDRVRREGILPRAPVPVRPPQVINWGGLERTVVFDGGGEVPVRPTEPPVRREE